MFLRDLLIGILLSSFYQNTQKNKFLLGKI